MSVRTILVLVAALFAWGAGPAAAADPIGSVKRVQAEAFATGGEGGDRVLRAGDRVFFGERVLTGPGARLEIEFADETSLTLGENAAMEMDSFVYDGSGGEMSLDMLAGAFAFTTGLIGKNDPENVLVTTPVSTIGIRGTTFWGGPIDEAYGVLVLEGAVEVANAGGAVLLDEAGEGTMIGSAAAAPGEVKSWSEEKTARAVATISFEE